MKTYVACIPCFLRQTIEACRMTGLSEEKTKEVLDKVALQIPGIKMTASPPAMGKVIHSIIKEHANNPDPYKELKRQSNDMALAAYPGIKKMVENSEDRLLKAVEVAIAGNIIDYGAVFNLDINKEINSIVKSEEENIRNADTRYFAYGDFVRSLAGAKTLLYLADNAGEIVFDRILIEEIKAAYPGIQITCAVRGTPIINDCVISDAVYAGLDKVAIIISSGSDAPGTLLETCSEEFLQTWHTSDMIISKGQGNFESLSGVRGPVFFLFIIKCQVLADDIGRQFREVILYRENHDWS